jgi:hypothetical protein
MARAVIALLQGKEGPLVFQALLPNEPGSGWSVDFEPGSLSADEVRLTMTWLDPPPSDVTFKRAMDYLSAIRDHCRAVAEEGPGDTPAGLAREILSLMDESVIEEDPAEYDES